MARRTAAAGEEAVGIYRQLAEALPDAFVSSLADALHNLSLYRVHGILGRLEEALAACDEAVGMYRRLAESDAFLVDLAMGLGTLATTLDELARREEALEAGEEAAGIYRRLAEAYPDVFLSTLADALNNLAIYRGNAGRPEEALDPGKDAAGMYRRLAEADAEAFLPRLADALHNLGAVSTGAGRGEEVLPAMEDALTWSSRCSTGHHRRRSRPHGRCSRATWIKPLRRGASRMPSSRDGCGKHSEMSETTLGRPQDPRASTQRPPRARARARKGARRRARAVTREVAAMDGQGLDPAILGGGPLPEDAEGEQGLPVLRVGSGSSPGWLGRSNNMREDETWLRKRCSCRTSRGEEIADGKGATIRITFRDARKRCAGVGRDRRGGRDARRPLSRTAGTQAEAGVKGTTSRGQLGAGPVSFCRGHLRVTLSRRSTSEFFGVIRPVRR